MKDPSSWRTKFQIRQWHLAAIKLFPRNLHNKKILELGAGRGEFVAILSQNGARNIQLADGSSKYVNNLKKKGLNAKLADFNYKLPFRSNLFDIVVSLETIEHLENAELFVKEVNRILKKNGSFILSTPNFAWIGYRLRYLVGRPPYHEGYHIRHFTFNSLNKLLLNNRFELLATNSITPLPIINKLLLKMPPPIRPIWLKVNIFQNLLSQNLVFKVRKTS